MGCWVEPGEEQEQHSALSTRLDIDLVGGISHVLDIYIVLSGFKHSCDRARDPAPISPSPGPQDIYIPLEGSKTGRPRLAESLHIWTNGGKR